MNMARSTFYKRPHAGHRAAREKTDTDLRVRIEDILAEFPAYGYRRVTHELRRRGLVGFYPARADTSEKAHLGPGGVSWQSEGSTARSLNVRRSG